VRRAPALIAAAALVASLSACAGSGAAGCTPADPSGRASDIVEVEGTGSGAPRIDFPTPLVSDGPQVSTVRAGDGLVLRDGDIADFQVTVQRGDDGSEVTASSYDPAQPIRRVVGDDPERTDALGRALECSAVGARVAFTTSVADLYGAGRLDPASGLEDDDTLVVVLDVQDGFPGRADGAPEPGVNGLPAVVRDPVTGRPGISIPNQDPPADTRIATLRAGDGETVAAGDTVVVQYTGVDWEAGDVVDSTWESGVAANVVATPLADGGSLPGGLVDAIVGAKVGSQVMAVIPPGEDGYGQDTAPSGLGADATTVFVVDVLGIIPAS